MNALRAWLTLGAAAALLFSGCRRSEPTPSPPPRAAAGPAAAAGSAAESVRAVVMESVALGPSISADGSIASRRELFAPGDPLFVSLRVGAISPGTEVKLAWYGPGERNNGEEQLVVPAGASVVNFKARDTAAWVAGDHRLDIWIGGAKAGSKSFRIGPAAGPAATAAGAPR